MVRPLVQSCSCGLLFFRAYWTYELKHDWSLLDAINPIHALRILFSPANKVGILILGSIFLATTGAEALYSDVGHVGKSNIMALGLMCLFA